MSAYTFKPRNDINSFRKKTFNKSLGGAMAPLAPPWLRHCNTPIGVRANIHWGGGNRVCPNGFGGGGGSSRNVPSSPGARPIRWGGGVVAECFRNIPSIRVIRTCIVFCPNNVDSLPELMSTNCPNWGGGAGHCPAPSGTPMNTPTIVISFCLLRQVNM